MNTSQERVLTKLRKAPLVSLSKMTGKLSEQNAVDISRAAEEDAQRLILVGSYAYHRAIGLDHESARKQAQGRLARVRKALGYSYPKSGLAEGTW